MRSLKNLNLKKKIALLMTSAVFVIGIAAWVLLYRSEKRDTIDYTESMLSRYLDNFAAAADRGGLSALDAPVKLWSDVYPDGRVTVIGIDGDVLSDTKAKASEMENHYNRREVLGAFANGFAKEVRYSSTQREWQIYIAKKAMLPGNPGIPCVVRVSYPLARLSGLVKDVTIPFIKYFAVILLLVWLGTYYILRVIMRPLNGMSRAAAVIVSGGEARFPISDDPEIRALSEVLNRMQDSLRSSAAEARERKEELSQLVGALPVGVLLIDGDKRIRYSNAEVVRICGGTEEMALRGASVEVLLPSALLFRMLDEEDGRKTLTLSDGKKIEASTMKLPRGRLIVLLDLTEKARLEEVRREFFLDAGHEFRTPLAIIRTGLELLRDSPSIKGEGAAEDIEMIDGLIRQQDRMSRLIEDMLLVVRLDSAPKDHGREMADAAAVALDVKRDIEALPRTKKLSIEVNAPVGGAGVGASEPELRRALLNVMENSSKYIEEGGAAEGKISVDIYDDGSFWNIVVDDNGPGVPAEERELIFEPFRRGDAHRARSGRGGGYGLGLSISRRIAEHFGGSLTLAKSKLGGAAFQLRVPK